MKKDLEKVLEPMRKLDPTIIRVDDYVRIIKPEMFVRCGYPLSKKEVEEDVKKLFGHIVEDLVHSVSKGDKFIARNEEGFYLNEQMFKTPSDDQTYNEIINALAYKRLILKNFGGVERSIHTEPDPKLMNLKAQVIEIKYVQSGVYNKAHSGYSYYGEWEGEQAYLSDTKTHKILRIDNIKIREPITSKEWQETIDPEHPWIEAINVKKITKEEYNSEDKIINSIDRLEVL